MEVKKREMFKGVNSGGCEHINPSFFQNRFAAELECVHQEQDKLRIGWMMFKLE
jgi:hypothetical protein